MRTTACRCGEQRDPSGTIHPILARLEQAGWLESRWEEIDPSEKGRPRRRYYRFTSDGAALACTALARAGTSARTAVVARLRPDLVGGEV